MGKKGVNNKEWRKMSPNRRDWYSLCEVNVVVVTPIFTYNYIYTSTYIYV